MGGLWPCLWEGHGVGGQDSLFTYLFTSASIGCQIRNCCMLLYINNIQYALMMPFFNRTRLERVRIVGLDLD